LPPFRSFRYFSSFIVYLGHAVIHQLYYFVIMYCSVTIKLLRCDYFPSKIDSG
jgi:hypothetical protein